MRERRRGIRPRRAEAPQAPIRALGHARLPLREEAGARIAGLLALACVPVVGVAWLLASAPLAMAAAFGLALAAVSWFVLEQRAERIRAELARMAEGELWADWAYEPGQWRRFRARGRSALHWRLVRRSGLILLGGLVVLGAHAIDEERSLGGLAPWAWLGILLGIALGTGLAGAWFERYVREYAGEPPRRCLIGPAGIYLDGLFLAFARPDQRLIEASSGDAPEPHLQLRFRVRSGRNSQRRTLEVPVPPGREREAQDALVRLWRLT